MLKNLILTLSLLISFTLNAQCNGNFGEPIFTQDFGYGAPNSYGNPLAAGVTTYNYRTFVGYRDLQDGEYTIATNPNLGRQEYFYTTDHTFVQNGQTNGYLMVVNAAFDPGEFYRERVYGLCAGQTYELSFWVMNVLPFGVHPNQIPINVGFKVFDESANELNQSNTGDINSTTSPTWYYYSFDFQLTSEQNFVDIVLLNNGVGGIGNDLAIDDIQLRACQSGEFSIEANNEIFTSGVNDNLSDFQISVIQQDNPYQNPVFVLQQSSDNGQSWTTINQNATGIFTVLVNTYQDGDLFRILISEEDNLGNANCSIFLGPNEVIINQNNPTPREITICDDDFDGINTFNFDALLQELEQEYGVASSQDIVYLANSYTGLSMIEDVSTSPNFVHLCDTSFTAYEVAVDQNQDVYLSSNNNIYKVDVDNCTFQNVGTLPDGSRGAMSFDTQNNLYVGSFNHSKVYRADAGQFNNFYLWHDFQNGSSGGDFVVIGSYMYIAWKENGNDVLYRAELGPNNEYLSHNNLGQIETDTFGLAAENGRLYGVTPDFLYEIDLDSMDTSIVLNRTGTPWWGAAGLHEASGSTISFHETEAEAQSGQNELGLNYTNTTPFQQTVYIRVYDEATGDVIIIPLNLTVNTSPETTPAILNNCAQGGGNPSFDLEDAISQMINDTTGISIAYYTSEQDAENANNPISNPQDYTPTNLPASVHVTFDNGVCLPSINVITLNVDNASLNIQTSYDICAGETITLDVGSSFDSYQWTGLQGVDIANNDPQSSSITITNPGTYQIAVTYGNGCTATETIIVAQEIAPVFQDVLYNEICSENTSEDISVTTLLNELNQIDNTLYYELFLTTNEAELGTNVLGGSQQMNDGQQLIIKVKNNASSNCYSLYTLDIAFLGVPDVTLEEEYFICEGETLSLSLDSSLNYTWTGFQGEDITNNNVNSHQVNLTQSGTYSVEVDNGNCNEIFSFQLNYSPSAMIFSVEVDGNDITILSNGTASAQYSINGQDWYNNPHFTGLENGVYTAYITDGTLCGRDNMDFVIFSINNVITPNGDGINDTWQIVGLDNYPDSVVVIYDRYGKEILNQKVETEFYWDGTYAGKTVPSTDYWYIIQVSDGRKFTGHITVMNH